MLDPSLDCPFTAVLEDDLTRLSITHRQASEGVEGLHPAPHLHVVGLRRPPMLGHSGLGKAFFVPPGPAQETQPYSPSASKEFRSSTSSKAIVFTMRRHSLSFFSCQGCPKAWGTATPFWQQELFLSRPAQSQDLGP